MTTRFYEAPTEGACRSAPAALRNREPIAHVLEQWLPSHGLVLEIASGTGEHGEYFARRFPTLDWQLSDIDEGALRAISARQAQAGLANLREPIAVDSASADWPVERADAIVAINMVHISPWSSALGLLANAERLLAVGAPLILYGPWLQDGVATAPSNLDFDRDLRSRNPDWGLRSVGDLEAAAEARRLTLAEIRAMPANNLMIRLVRTE